MCCGWELAEFVGALNKERFAFALITMGVSACLEAVAVLQPSHRTASTALLGEVGGHQTVGTSHKSRDIWHFLLCDSHGYVNMQDIRVFRPCGC